MKNAVFLLCTVAVLAACGGDTKPAAVAKTGDPALVAPAPELLAQLEVAAIAHAPVAETLRVPGSIDFSASVPQQSSGLGGGLAMYRHPYDKNAAATGVESGKAIDVTG